MKANELFFNGQELEHKLRTVKDVIRHIRTREGDTANYNVLLGAGASRTSGINTGYDLIRNWTIELYERFEKKQPESFEKAREYLETKQGSWYNPLNPYSSLFEKKYDLPSQRRRFVENEVDSKLPSIGYAYLVSLINDSYINSIFTTNFDDLVNEAFYQLSNVRPILCAHDSSVHSISISSKRPKIIKLHGDYLFDDIKSTLRETESLEQNIKEKFIEFSKEFGLIVVGYSGHDRSIMDVLEFLCKQDNYLNNGIYWCFRSEDEICHTLRNLIWKDKVYPVIINGFDEFFAEVHFAIKQSLLSFDANGSESKLKKTINKIILDEDGLSRNEYINAQLLDMRNNKSRQDIGGFLNNAFDDKENSKLSFSNMRNLLEIESIIKMNDYEKALELSIGYCQESSLDAKPAYMRKIIGLYKIKKDLNSAIMWSEKLIDLDSNHLPYHFSKIKMLNSNSEKKSELIKLKDKFKKKIGVYNELVALAINSRRLDFKDVSFEDEEVEEFILSSKRLDPSLSNAIFQMEFDWIEELKKSSDNEGSSFLNERVDKLISSMDSICDEHIATLKIKVEQVLNAKVSGKLKVLIAEIYRIYNISSNDKRMQLNKLLNRLHLSFVDFENVDVLEVNQFLKKFYTEHLKDKEIDGEYDLLIGKSRYFTGVGDNFKAAETYLNSAVAIDDFIEDIETALLLADCVGTMDFVIDKAVDLLDKYSYNYSEEVRVNALYEISIYSNDYKSAEAYIERSFAIRKDVFRYLTQLSYVFLLQEKYSDVIELSKKYNRVSHKKSSAFRTNVLFATKKMGLKLDSVELSNLSASPNSAGVRICAFIIRDRTIDAKRLLKEELSREPLRYFYFKSWPIIDSAFLDEVRGQAEMTKAV